MNRHIVLTKIEQRLVRFSYENDSLIAIDVISNQTNQLQIGEIYTARVKNIVKNIEAAFVQIQDETCYFSLADNKNIVFLNPKKDQTVHEGDLILVQVEREAVKTKQTAVGSDYQLTGELLVYTPTKPGVGVSKKISIEKREQLLECMNAVKQLPDTQEILAQTMSEFGFIVRTNAQNATKEQMQLEAILLLSKWKDIVTKAKTSLAGVKLYTNQDEYKEMLRFIGASDSSNYVITDDEDSYHQLNQLVNNNSIDETRLNNAPNAELDYTNSVSIRLHDKEISLTALYDLQSFIKDALSKKVWLKSGGFLIIEPTEALTVIDVNTGKSIQKKATKEEHSYHINVEAADEIARQLRIRNYSGIIIVDFIDMKNQENQQALLNHIKKLLKQDSIQSTLIDITGLGLVELTRKKIKKPLHEQWQEGN